MSNSTIVFQHATMTYYRMKLTVKGQLETIEWTGGNDRRQEGFEGAYYRTSDDGMIAALKAHPQYNKTFMILDKFQEDQLENSKVEKPTQKRVGENDAPKAAVVAPDSVETVQEKAEFINENFGVAKSEINTAAKIKAWIKANPGKVTFTG